MKKEEENYYQKQVREKTQRLVREKIQRLSKKLMPTKKVRCRRYMEQKAHRINIPQRKIVVAEHVKARLQIKRKREDELDVCYCAITNL